MTTARTCLQASGHMAATNSVVPLVRLHRRCLQARLASMYVLSSTPSPSNTTCVHIAVIVNLPVLCSLQSPLPLPRCLMGNHYRHFPSRLWSSLQVPHGARRIVTGDKAAHQYFRIPNSPQHLPPFLTSDPESHYMCCHGQHSLYVLRLQTGYARSCSLCAEAIRFWNWCMKNSITPTAM